MPICSQDHLTVSIIGSFRKFYDEVLETIEKFQVAGIEVQSPIGKTILEPGIEFVRFNNDPPEWTNSLVQTVALHRILRASFVFVVAPGGYVGRTTCYEIGRVIQARRPLFFSERPNDLPIAIRDEHVLDANEIIQQILQFSLSWNPAVETFEQSLESDLLDGKYRKEHEFKG